MKNFNYQKICANLIKGLPSRTADVIERRFGLRKGKPETLETIGQSYGRTRERVRQIEEDGLSRIKDKLSDCKDVFRHFEKTLQSFGGVKKEEEVLEILGGKKFQNQTFFLLVLDNGFQRILEDNKFYTCWALNKKAFRQAQKTIKSIISKFKQEEKPLAFKDKILLSCVEISKEIEQNPQGLYGLRDWIEINPRGVKDRAYLVLKKQKKPLHFRDITNLIDNLPFPSQGKTHTATVHNELIKDQRFVLVGRGLYALSEWGYLPGLVRDVIYQTLKESKRPLTKEEILNKVLEQRFVRPNTVALNLQNNSCFVKDNKGRYRIA